MIQSFIYIYGINNQISYNLYVHSCSIEINHILYRIEMSSNNMTCNQEIFNAITMIVPTSTLAVCFLRTDSIPVLLLLTGSLIHLPVSMTYHIMCAFNRFEDKIDNNMRRLDQALQHVVGTLYSFVLSGSYLYTAFVSIPNLIWILELYNPMKSNDRKRYKNVLKCILLYCFPMIIIKKDFINTIGTLTSLSISSLFFLHMKGYGHGLFHISMGFFSYFISRSVINI